MQFTDETATPGKKHTYRVIAVNTKSIFLTAKAFVGPMKQRASGAILNIASTAMANIVKKRPPSWAID